MSIRIISPLICCILLSIVTVSCKKYLDLKPDKIQVVPESLSDLQRLLDDDFIMNAKMPAYSEASTDDFFLTKQTYEAASIRDRQVYTWQLEPYNFSNDWAACYNIVFNSNYCLEMLAKLERTTANERSWNNVKGSAHFFRGYIYLHLLWEYSKSYDPESSESDFGIVLREGSDYNQPSIRSSVRAGYRQVIADLMTASQFLPNVPVHPMRPSLAAAYGSLARCYLSMNQYDSAFKYAELCLDQNSQLLDYNSSEVNPGSMTPFQPFNKEIIFYATQRVSHSLKYSDFAFQDTLLYASYADLDLRKSVYYFKNGQYYGFKGHYTADPYNFFSGITISEIVLIRAEAHARMNRITDAMNDLNRLLEHRWVSGSFIPLTAASSDEALGLVLQERRKELTMRNLRWMDIKRLNKLGAGITLKRIIENKEYILPPNDSRFALPLPDDIIRITGIPQN